MSELNEMKRNEAPQKVHFPYSVTGAWQRLTMLQWLRGGGVSHVQLRGAHTRDTAPLQVHSL